MANSMDKASLAKLEETAQGIAQIVGPLFDRAGAGFALIGFQFGDGGWTTYVSNAERDGVIKALRECADIIERNQDMPPIGAGEPEA